MADTHTTDPRLLMFSHDTFGLGHLRRSTTLAKACSERIENLSTLYVTGAQRPYRFGIPDGCDVVKLPALSKDALGRYVPRTLDVSTDMVLSLRRGMVLEMVRRFAPHAILVDHAPLGAAQELRPALEWIREHRTGTKVILGMRDILDEPERVRGEFGSETLAGLIDRYYDQVLVYGDQRIFDPVKEYELPESAARKVSFVGYVTTAKPNQAHVGGGDRMRILIQGGGGEDAARLYDVVLEALAGPLKDFDANFDVTYGPFLSEATQQRLASVAASDARVRVCGFRDDIGSMLQQSDLLIGMAGANTAAEVLATSIPSILAPRRRPRREQLTRAQRLKQLDLIRTLDTDRNDAPEKLAGLVRQAAARELLPPVRMRPNCDGARNVAHSIAELLQRSLGSDAADSLSKAMRHG